MCISPCCAVGDTVSGCTGSSSLSGLVIGVLSVSCSSELLLSFSALGNTSTSLLMRTTSSPQNHGQHTLCYWTTHYISCMLSGQHKEITSVRVYNIYVYVCVRGRGEAREGRESDVAYRQELAHFIHDHTRARTHKHTVHVYILEWVCPHVQEGEGLALQRGGRRWSLISSQHRHDMCTQ